MMIASSQISKWFRYYEIVRTDHRAFADTNHPSTEQLLAIKALCCHVLDPVRDHFRQPVITHSVFRGLVLNRAIGSSDDSQHTKGEAADFHVVGVSLFDVARFIATKLEWDQLILEYVDASGSSGWIHCSYTDTQPNRRILNWKDGKRNYERITVDEIPG